MQLANRKIKVCFPILNIFFFWNKQLNNPTPTQFKGEKFGTKTKVKIVKKIFAVDEYGSLFSIYLIYEKSHKSANLLQNC